MPVAMSGYPRMSPSARRAWAIGIIAFFVVLFTMVGVSQWYAIHVNVPKYEALKHAPSRP